MPKGVVEISFTHRFLRFSTSETLRLVHSVLGGEGRTVTMVGISFVDDRAMKTLNTRHLRHPWATDVISFLYRSSPGIDGEIIINLDQARRQAPKFGAIYSEEVRRLIVHGLLHLAGHDDRSHRLRDRMHGLENRYLA